RRDRIVARRGLVTPGRHHPGMVGDIKSERWATSSGISNTDQQGHVILINFLRLADNFWRKNRRLFRELVGLTGKRRKLHMPWRALRAASS
ncbi:hypothetical protein, partial [Bradyrhizobium murdochi]|uniref:hypothetical protein n=1 Tax=Bradyrhizobium murdochi TaxID=1038859 RepID=UPI001AEC0088